MVAVPIERPKKFSYGRTRKGEESATLTWVFASFSSGHRRTAASIPHRERPHRERGSEPIRKLVKFLRVMNDRSGLDQKGRWPASDDPLMHVESELISRCAR